MNFGNHLQHIQQVHREGKKSLQHNFTVWYFPFSPKTNKAYETSIGFGHQRLGLELVLLAGGTACNWQGQGPGSRSGLDRGTNLHPVQVITHLLAVLNSHYNKKKDIFQGQNNDGQTMVVRVNISLYRDVTGCYINRLTAQAGGNLPNCESSAALFTQSHNPKSYH